MQQLGQSAGQIESDLTGRSHAHKIGWDWVNWDEDGTIDGANFNEASVILHFHGQDHNIPINQFLDALGLYWGSDNLYTYNAHI